MWFFSYKKFPRCCSLSLTTYEIACWTFQKMYTLNWSDLKPPDIYTANLSLLSLWWKTRLSFLQKLILDSKGILCQKHLVGLSDFAAVYLRLGSKSFHLQSLQNINLKESAFNRSLNKKNLQNRVLVYKCDPTKKTQKQST